MLWSKTSIWWILATFIWFVALGFLLASQSDHFLTTQQDLSYHLLTAEGFRQAGGPVTTEYWAALPDGRPHTYPPLFHLLLSIFITNQNSLSQGFVVGVWMIFTLATLILGWVGIQRLWSARAATIFLTLVSGHLFVVTFIGMTMPASLVLLAAPFLVWLLKEKRVLGGVLLLALMFYTHRVIPWFLVASLLGAGLIYRDYWRPALKISLGGIILYLPWIIQMALNWRAIKYLNPELVKQFRPDIINVYYVPTLLFLLFIPVAYALIRLRRALTTHAEIGLGPVFFVVLFLAQLPLLLSQYPNRFIISGGALALLVIVALAF